MQTANKYMILSSGHSTILGREVEEYLSKGWMLFGTHQVVVVDGRAEYSQALIKVGESRPTNYVI